MSERRYEIGFFIGPCSEQDAELLLDAILDLPEFRDVHGGGIGLAAVESEEVPGD